MAKHRKTGGRKKGTKNKATIEREKAAAADLEKAKADGTSPLEYLLKLMRDESKGDELRFEAAKAAAPYIHPKLSAIEHSGKDGGPIESKGEFTVKFVAASASA